MFALWCALATPTVLLGFLLPWAWGISSWLLQQSAAFAPYLGWGLSPHRCPSWPSMWDSSSRPSCTCTARAPWTWGCSFRPPPLTSGLVGWGCSSRLQPLASGLGRGVSPPGRRPWPRTQGNSSSHSPWPWMQGNSSCRHPWPRTLGISSRPLPPTSDTG